MPPEAIKIDGLREMQASMKAMDANLPKQLRIFMNSVVVMVADSAKAKVPHGRSGYAAASIKPQSTQRMGQVKAGGAKAPYYPWLDFGGSVGRNHSVHRPFFKKGRYLFVAYESHKAEIETKAIEGLNELARKSGLEAHFG